MIPATTPSDLLSVAEALAERGANGFLLSGGSDNAGRIRIADFVGAIKEIKATTDLKINAPVDVHVWQLPRALITGISNKGKAIGGDFIFGVEEGPLYHFSL
jgi:uncharacterized radical SAM superfamily protein